MNETDTRSIEMPPTAKYPSGHQLQLRDRILVVIGSNGSGKTRFGVWLDSRNIQGSHRVSAHRSLVFPERVQPIYMEDAELQLLYGPTATAIADYGPTDESDLTDIQRIERWQNKPATARLNDFEPLVTLMISESFKVSDQYRMAMQKEDKYVAPPKTRLDLVKQIWEMVLPGRELVTSGNRIETRNRQDQETYHAQEMSDGERGIFYLIGEALSVKKDGIFIIDEPELHLHRAIQARLWDAIEAARPDCTFVYITHDLGFAASRKDATKIWLREYTNNKWDWEEVPESDAFAEPLLLEMMGSRQPILFVEGNRSSLDYFIYGKIFPEYTIVPCGSCEAVIHSTVSFTKMQNLHHNTCGGLIDRDGRSETDIKNLNESGIAVLPVALIENLFLLEPILILAAEKLGHNSAEIVQKVKERVFATLSKNSVRIVSNLTRQEIETALRNFGKSGDGATELSGTFKNTCNAIVPTVIYAKWEGEIGQVIAKKDYATALRYYKIKGLSAEADGVFRIKFQEQVMRWLRSGDTDSFVTTLRSVIPPNPMSLNPSKPKFCNLPLHAITTSPQ